MEKGKPIETSNEESLFTSYYKKKTEDYGKDDAEEKAQDDRIVIKEVEDIYPSIAQLMFEKDYIVN
jgi:hypothetical protein